MALVMSGTALGVERVSGKKDDGTPYAFQQIHLLDGFRVHRLVVDDEFKGAMPGEGEDVAVEVTGYARGQYINWRAHRRVELPNVSEQPSRLA